MSAAPEPSANPYVGARAFQRGELFFGRDEEAARLTALLTAERIVLLYSPSGAGKSSLIAAGLVPALERRKFSVPHTIRVSIAPTVATANRYVLSALLSLEEGVPRERQLPLAQLAAMSLDEYLQLRAAEGARTLLIFDQFEEILTGDPTDHEAKQAFFAQLGTALENRQRWALLAMREDYLAGLDPYRRHIPNRLQESFRLELLGPTAARLAISEPAARRGVSFTPEAIDRLVDDLRQTMVQGSGGDVERRPGPTIEPVQLQVVCQRIWERLRPDSVQITPDDLGEVGSVDQALGDYYAERVAGAAAHAGVRERDVREWCERELITEQGLRGQVGLSQAQSRGLPNAAIQYLVDSYLLRREERRGAIWFELAHDRLVAPLRANNEAWFEGNLAPVERQIRTWRDQGKPDALLLRDKALAEAEAWAAERGGALSPDDREFLERSRREAQVAQAKARAARWRLSFLVVTALVLAGAFALVSLLLRGSQASEAVSRQLAATAQAAEQRARAAEATSTARLETAKVAQVAALTGALRDSEPDLALLLGVAAYRRSEGLDGVRRDAESYLYGSVANVSSLVSLLHGFEGEPTSAAFSPDGALLAIGDNRSQLQLWEVAAQRRVFAEAIQECGCGITSLSFSQDGARLAAGAGDGTLAVLDVATRRQTLLPRDLGGRVNVLAFNPNPKYPEEVAVGMGDGRLLLVNLGSTAAPQEIGGRERGFNSLAFDPGGDLVATTASERRVMLWNLRDGSQPVELALNDGDIVTDLYRVAISGDGRWLAASGFQRVFLWDLKTRQRVGDPLQGHTSFVNGLAFKPNNSSILVTAGTDQQVMIWSTSVRNLFESRRAQNGAISTLAMSKNGRLLATVGSDKTVALWSFEETGGVAQRIDGYDMRGRLRQLAIVDGAAVGLVQREEGITPYALYTRRVDEPLAEDQPALRDTEPFTKSTDPALSADGRRFAQGFANHTAVVYEAGGAELAVLRDDQPPENENSLGLYGLSMSGDGARVAAGRGDGTVLVWDVASPEKPALRFVPDGDGERGHSRRVISSAFSRDGRYLATGSWDQRVFLWDLEEGSGQHLLDGGENIISLAFSNDGRLLAAGGEQSVYLLDIVSERLVVPPLAGHTNEVRALAFSPDDRMLASGGIDRQVLLWRIPGEGETLPLLAFGRPLLITPFGGWIRALAFSDDQQLIVGHEFSAWAVDLRPERLVELACRMAGRDLSAEEWRAYVDQERPGSACPQP
jgi:WD40 repeat protein